MVISVMSEKVYFKAHQDKETFDSKILVHNYIRVICPTLVFFQHIRLICPTYIGIFPMYPRLALIFAHPPTENGNVNLLVVPLGSQ